MSNQVTVCASCDHVAEHTRKMPQRRWLCLKFPRVEGGSFVDPTWRTDDPYNYCYRVNLGHCPLFEQRRQTNENRDEADDGGFNT